MKVTIQVEPTGGFLTHPHPARVIKGRLGGWFDRVAAAGMQQTRGAFKAGIHGTPGHPATGQTAAGVEGPSPVRQPKGTNLVVAKLRMRASLTRASDPNPRVPYIIAAVLESGHYGGRRVSRVTLRADGSGKGRVRWKAGRTQKARKALHAFATASKAMQSMVNGAPPDLTRGLD